MNKILLVCAMEEEFKAIPSWLKKDKISYLVTYDKDIKQWFYEFELGKYFVRAVYLGITYFNSSKLALILNNEPFDLVINFGTCAGLTGQVPCRIIKTDRFRCSDLFSEGIGRIDGSMMKDSYEENTVHEDIQVSGSRFLSSKAEVDAVLKRFPNAKGFDMESFMWYSICKAFEVKFVSFRAVSDNGDEDISKSFEENVLKASMASVAEVFTSIITNEVGLYINNNNVNI